MQLHLACYITCGIRLGGVLDGLGPGEGSPGWVNSASRRVGEGNGQMLVD